jgi:hypothetical protein
MTISEALVLSQRFTKRDHDFPPSYITNLKFQMIMVAFCISLGNVQLQSGAEGKSGVGVFPAVLSFPS